jgi:diamine N-acetyltransferase
MEDPDIHFTRLTPRNVVAICRLSETLLPGQRQMVADNAWSIAQGHCSENVWMRAIYAGDTPAGFIMLHLGSDYEDGIDCPGAFLWRFMIAGPFQGQGWGRLALERLCRELKAQGYSELYTSCQTGEGGPEGFYRRFGFTPTGDAYDDEPEFVKQLS